MSLLEAIQRTRPALDAAGVTVSVTKTLVASEAQAEALGQEPPLGLIVEAIMRHAGGAGCCDPKDKAGCCGEGVAAAGCGCQA